MSFHIAIIGGGVSGLSAAYYLQQQALSSGQALDITVYERKPQFGGNADTVVVKLGTLQNGQGQPERAFIRWADLGVNDVNLATYVKLAALMKDIGYLQHMKPLQDTTSYFTADGNEYLTDDAALYNGVSDARFNLAQTDGGELSKLIAVVHQHAIDLVAPPAGGPPPVPVSYTVAHYFDSCIANPEGMLAATARRLQIQINWGDPAIPARIARIRDEIYYPRISAMYFTDNETGPGGMPLQSPFQYYRVQEGGVTPDRRYFEYGSQHWLQALARWMEQHSTDKVKVRHHMGAPVKVTISPASAVVTPSDAPPEHVDLVLMALHADDALHALEFKGIPTDTAHAIQATLHQVRYTRSYGVCHTDDRLLPRNRNVWRTYNVLVHSPAQQVQPYRMSYVENFHQNDPLTPSLDHIGLPMFFTSLLPDLKQVQANAVLTRLNGDEVPQNLRDALPHLAQSHAPAHHPQTGYSHELGATHAHLAGKAWALFKHNVLNVNCIDAQSRMQAINEDNAQRPLMPLFFGGGWTNGAGLHEQCLAQSQLLTQWAQRYINRHQAA
ncbi:FAD-dependent oxidoreductase [Aquabacterium sp.]|uniref:FAD-dependent oxidoreductase n=1 Tax=Aquabacterium sp. TaxID=1872578 RepID=UPI0025BC6344|nr:FAD-dependent oxidoreductase [Aquabacterium sp.]